MGFPPGPGSGLPGNPNNPGGSFTTSSFTITSSDKLLLVTLDVDWKSVYYERDGISQRISSAVDMLKGEALMMTGRAHWHMVASVAKKFQAAGAIPYAAYPRATNSNRFDLPYLPEQRVSWMADMLPYLGYDTLSRKIKRDAAWNDEANLEAGSAWIPEFLNPELPEATWRAYVPSLKGRDLGATHFVGLTGIGMESGEFPDTPEYAKKLGIFGWNRQAKFADIVNGDGAANTIFMIQVPPNVQRPWIRGGGSTAQGVPATGSIKPFVSSVGGRKGTYAVMADGSVRFISDSIDDAVFQALVTYKGGEKIDNLDQIAPPEKIRTGEAVIITNPPPKVEPKVEEPPKKEESRKEEPRDPGNAKSTEGAWTKVTHEKSGISFSLPGEPTKSGEVPLGTGQDPTKKGTVYVFAPNGTKARFTVMFRDADEEQRNIYELGRKSGLSKEVTFGENKGLYTDFNGQQYTFTVLSKEWSVQFDVNGEAPKEDREKFFSSVKLGKRKQ
jgi:hypothetical protein